MAKRTLIGLVTALCIAPFLGCASGRGAKTFTIGLTIGAPVQYRSAGGELFTARYGSLSDGSLHFVKVQAPDGKEYTLPQVLSASGVRYTDERDMVWWEHQGSVRVDVRDAQGNWVTKYPALEEVRR